MYEVVDGRGLRVKIAERDRMMVIVLSHHTDDSRYSCSQTSIGKIGSGQIPRMNVLAQRFHGLDSLC